MTDTAELIAKLRAKNMHLNDLGRTALIEDPDCIEAADALASLVRERDEARADNERDRSIIIDARNAIHDAIARRSWLLSGGRGSYEWDDDRWRDEFGAAIDEIGKPLEILERLGVNWVNCPTDHASIVEARIDWKARATAAEADAARMREALEMAHIWHEEQDKSLSKQPPSHGPNGNQWARLQHREQMDAIRNAIGGKDE